jgi:hypothetical protein
MEIRAIGLLAVKAETTYGTDPVPTVGSNLIPTARDTLDWKVDATAIARKPLDGLLGNLAGFNSMPNVTLKFRYEARGNRTDGSAADISSGSISNKVEIDPLLLAANMTATYTAASGGGRNGYVSYVDSIQLNSGPSVTCYWWSQKKLHKLVGGKVDFSVVAGAGDMIYIDFTVRGKYIVAADTTFPTTSAWVSTKPPIFEAGAVTIGAFQPVISQARFDLGNVIAVRPDPTDGTGIAGFVITDNDSKGSIDPEADTEATNPFWADWRASTVRAISIATPYTAGASSNSGNGLVVSAFAEMKSVNYADRNNIRIHSIDFNIVRAGLGTPGALTLTFR